MISLKLLYLPLSYGQYGRIKIRKVSITLMLMPNRVLKTLLHTPWKFLRHSSLFYLMAIRIMLLFYGIHIVQLGLKLNINGCRMEIIINTTIEL